MGIPIAVSGALVANYGLFNIVAAFAASSDEVAKRAE